MITTQAEIIGLFSDAIADHGFKVTGDIVADGALHRCNLDGHSKDTRNGAYVLHLDGKRPAGWFMDYKTGSTLKWAMPRGKDDAKHDKQAQDEINRQIQYAKEVRAKEIADLHRKSAERARHIWHRATPITETGNQPYLAKKRVQAHGVRLNVSALVIPLQDETGAIVNLQFILPDGTKRFLSGGRKKGCYFIIGEPTETILICEGYATGATLHEQTGKQVIIAFDAGNLNPVAQAMRAMHSGEIIICGDNDSHGKGQQAANEAALSVGAKVLIPPVSGDWNDYFTSKAVAHG
ncbi:MAG: toprim domain-containing protein [Gammaproteobacteria bacterium]|nr:toprim domain-containing protein [Gammaproteobacteria bacterium]